MTESPNIATISPHPDAKGCEEEGCDSDEMLAEVSPDGINEHRVLCPTHRVAYLREVYDE